MPSCQIVQLAEIVTIGLASGILSGAFGIGGGIVSTPLIRHLLDVPAHVAIGSTLAVILPTAMVASINYLKQGKIVLPLAVATGIPAVLSTLIASHLSQNIKGQHLMLVLCGLMVLVGLDVLTDFRAKLQKSAKDETQGFVSSKKNLVIAVATGLGIGIISGFLGIGGGFLLVPAYCYFLRLPLKVAFGTSLVVVAVVAMPGTVVHHMYQHVDLKIVLPMLAGSIPGAWIGSYFSLRAKESVLKKIFGGLLIILSIYFMYKELSI